MASPKVTALIVAALVAFTPAGAPAAGMAGPPAAPVPGPGAARGIASDYFAGLVKAYRGIFGPLSSDRCRMAPSCSAYALRSVEKHGFLKGYLLTSGRLLHEIDQKDYARPVSVEGRLYWADPVANNDFWWSGGEGPGR